MSHDVYFCIPSYKRADRQKTLSLLESLGVPKEQIVLSVQTEDDLKEYTEKGIRDRVGELIYRPGDRVSVNMNTLLEHFPKGQKMVILEDDIKSISRLSISDGKKKLQPLTNKEQLDKLCQYGFGLCRKNRTRAFGLSMTRNPFFMRCGYATYGLSDTGLYGIINSDIRFDERLKLFQDTDMCAQMIKRYGAFIVLNDFCADITRFSDGGCKESWDKEETILEMQGILKQKYFDLLSFHDIHQNQSITLKKRKR